MTSFQKLTDYLPAHKVYFTAEGHTAYITYEDPSGEIVTKEITEYNVFSAIRPESRSFFEQEPFRLKGLVDHLKNEARMQTPEVVAARIACYDETSLIYKISDGTHAVIEPGHTRFIDRGAFSLKCGINFLTDSSIAEQIFPKETLSCIGKKPVFHFVEDLAKILHLTGTDKVLMAVAIVAAFHPSIRKPAFYPQSKDPNALKTFNFVVQDLIDPITSDSLYAPRSEAKRYVRFGQYYLDMPDYFECLNIHKCVIFNDIQDCFFDNKKLSRNFISIKQDTFGDEFIDFEDFKDYYYSRKPFILGEIFAVLQRALSIFNVNKPQYLMLDDAYLPWCKAVAKAIFGESKTFDAALKQRKGLPIAEINSVAFALLKILPKPSKSPYTYKFNSLHQSCINVVKNETFGQASYAWFYNGNKFSSELTKLKPIFKSLGYQIRDENGCLIL